jgi:O-antigen ligase
MCIAGCFYAAYAGLIMMLIVTLIVMLIYAFIFYPNKKHRRAMIVILLLSIILIINLFAWILPHDTNEMYKAKLRSLIMTTMQIDIAPEVKDPGDGPESEEKPVYTEESRFEFYMVSLKTFLKKPLFGVGPYFKTATVVNGIGNHSSWLDYLAMYGLIGCSPLILFLILVFRRSIKMTNYSANKVMRLVGWALFMGYGFLNPVFTAKNFPVVLMLLASGSVASGQLVKFLDVFRKNKSV